MKIINMMAILLSITLNTCAQISLKLAVSDASFINFKFHALHRSLCDILSNKWLFIGMVCYVISLFIWLYVLSKTAVSVAYPCASLGYILNAIAAHYVLSEQITYTRSIGLIVILFGVFLISKN